MTADNVIRLLGLQPHPEGGHYRETFRDPAGGASGRAHSTAIYFLLRAGEVSRWHRVDAAEDFLDQIAFVLGEVPHEQVIPLVPRSQNDFLILAEVCPKLLDG